MNAKTVAPEDFNFWIEEQITDPFPMYAEFQAKCPVARSKQLGGFAFAATYAESKEILSNFTIFSNSKGITLPPRPVKIYPVDLDPPEHNPYRRAMHHAFSQEVIDAARPRVQAVIDNLMDTFIERGSADLADDLIRPALPAMVLPFIGAPVEDIETLKPWLEALIRHREADPEGAVVATGKLIDYLQALVVQRRAEAAPGEDALGTLVKANVKGEPIPDENIASTLLALLIGGLDTTTSTTLDALYYLMNNPADAARLRAGEVNWTSAVDEMVRLFTPATGVVRTATQDTELGGVAIKKGEYVLALIGAANRDPAVFENPGKCVLDREDNPHVGFSNGAHICVGRFLARMEIELFLNTVLQRMPDVRPADGFKPTYIASSARQMRKLPVVFTPGARKG